jgi:hypothetical protein
MMRNVFNCYPTLNAFVLPDIRGNIVKVSNVPVSKVPDMMSLDELQISFPLFFIPKIHLITSYPETLTVKKLIKMRFFTIKIYYISS